MPSSTAEPLFSSLCVDTDMIEIVQEFLAELPQRLTQLHEAVERRSLPDLCRFAHQLKGAGGSYGYPQLTEIAADLEQLAKDAAPEGLLRQRLDRLVDVAARLQAAPAA